METKLNYQTGCDMDVRLGGLISAVAVAITASQEL
jgi:hypothetical protein